MRGCSRRLLPPRSLRDSRSPSSTRPADPARLGRSFVLGSDAEFSVGTRYSRTLRGRNPLDLYGTIDSGDVYRSPDQTLTVEGYIIHEAYLVVKESSLVDIYLPVEKTLTPISPHVFC